MAPMRPRGDETGSEKGVVQARSVMETSGKGVSGVSSPGDDTAFMEQILLELSAQNEHARAESARRPVPTPVPPTPAAATPLTAITHAASPGPAPRAEAERPRTVRVERDSAFKTAEGVSSARAYLPAKTLAPSRQELVQTDSVEVRDPRKLPTVRLPRRGSDDAPSSDSERTPVAGDEYAPTLRSASPVAAGPAPVPWARWWIGGVVVAALVGALLVALAARLRSPTAPQIAPRPGREAAAPVASSAASSAGGPSTPSSAPPSSTARGAPGAAANGDAQGATSAPDPSQRPRSRTKSDRWF